MDKVQMEKDQLQTDYEALQRKLEEFKRGEEQRAVDRTALDQLNNKLVRQKREAEEEKHDTDEAATIDQEKMDVVHAQLSNMQQQNIQLSLQLQEKEAERQRAYDQQRERLREMEKRLEWEKDEKDTLSERLSNQIDSRNSEEENMRSLLVSMQLELDRERQEKQKVAEDVEQRTKDNMRNVTDTVRDELNAIQRALVAEKGQRAKLEAAVEEQTELRKKMEDDVQHQVSQQQKHLYEEKLRNEVLAREQKQQLEQLSQQERRMSKQAQLADEEIQRARSEAASKEQELETHKIAAANRAREWESQKKSLESQAEHERLKLSGRVQEINADIKASGMDKDGYLAILISDYEQQIHTLTNEKDELQSINFALKLDAEERVGQLQSQLRRASGGGVGAAQLPMAQPVVEDRVRQVRQEMGGELRAMLDSKVRAEVEVVSLKKQLAKVEEENILYKLQVQELVPKAGVSRPRGSPRPDDDNDSLSDFLTAGSRSSFSRGGSAKPKGTDDEFDHVY
jgi:hypothetical protein